MDLLQKSGAFLLEKRIGQAFLRIIGDLKNVNSGEIAGGVIDLDADDLLAQSLSIELPDELFLAGKLGNIAVFAGKHAILRSPASGLFPGSPAIGDNTEGAIVHFAGNDRVELLLLVVLMAKVVDEKDSKNDDGGEKCALKKAQNHVQYLFHAIFSLHLRSVVRFVVCFIYIQWYFSYNNIDYIYATIEFL